MRQFGGPFPPGQLPRLTRTRRHTNWNATNPKFGRHMKPCLKAWGSDWRSLRDNFVAEATASPPTSPVAQAAVPSEFRVAQGRRQPDGSNSGLRPRMRRSRYAQGADYECPTIAGQPGRGLRPLPGAILRRDGQGTRSSGRRRTRCDRTKRSASTPCSRGRPEGGMMTNSGRPSHRC